MQDNVTQAEVIVARHIDAWGWGPLDQIEGLAEHKLAVDACAAGLASTAQPEVKALVEAVERSAKMIDKAASAAVDQDSPALAEALDNIEFRLRLALAAYHEAQP